MSNSSSAWLMSVYLSFPYAGAIKTSDGAVTRLGSSDNLKSVLAAAARQTPPESPAEIRAVVPGQVDAAGFGEILAELYDSGVGIPSHTVITALEVLHRARPKVRSLVLVDAHSQEISAWGHLERNLGGITLGGITEESVLER